jgi:hypothetical protein
MDLSKVQEVLGKEDHTLADGEDTVYSYEARYGFSVSARTNAKGQQEVSAVWVSLPSLGATPYRTAKGVGVGSLLEGVRKAYGEEEAKANNCLYYTSLGIEFHYFRISNRVVAVKVVAPSKKSPAQQPTPSPGAQAPDQSNKMRIEYGRGLGPLVLGMEWEALLKSQAIFQKAEGTEKLANDQTIYTYNSLGLQLVVMNDKGKTRLITIYIIAPRVGQFEVAGDGDVAVGAPRAKVVKALGNPEKEKKSPDGSSQIYYISKGVAFILQGDVVAAIVLFPPNSLQVK